MKVKKCAFTGHRPQSLPFGFNESDERCIALKQTLRAEIIRLIEQEGVTHFISGMALGVDMYAAEIVLGLKSSYEGITLESAIPCESQAEKWTEKQRDRYFEIASKCDKETLVNAFCVCFVDLNLLVFIIQQGKITTLCVCSSSLRLITAFS